MSTCLWATGIVLLAGISIAFFCKITIWKDKREYEKWLKIVLAMREAGPEKSLRESLDVLAKVGIHYQRFPEAKFTIPKLFWSAESSKIKARVLLTLLRGAEKYQGDFTVCKDRLKEVLTNLAIEDPHEAFSIIHYLTLEDKHATQQILNLTSH